MNTNITTETYQPHVIVPRIIPRASTTIVITLKIEHDGTVPCHDIVEQILDNGILQDEINEHNEAGARVEVVNAAADVFLGHDRCPICGERLKIRKAAFLAEGRMVLFCPTPTADCPFQPLDIEVAL